LKGNGNTAASLYGEGEETENVRLRKIEDVMLENNLDLIHLVNVNCEGCEYPLLEDWIEKGLIHKFCNIQIEFHRRILPETIARRCRIQEVLSTTFEKVYDFRFQWEHWRRKKPCQY
jgi:hypothetical protein